MKCYICNTNECDQVISEKYALAKHSSCNGITRCFVCLKTIRMVNTKDQKSGIGISFPKDVEQIFSGVYNHIACGPGSLAWKRFKMMSEARREETLQCASRRKAGKE